MSRRGSHGHRLGVTKKRNSYPGHVHPYQHQKKKQQNTNKRRSRANSIYDELDEADSLPLEQSQPSSVGLAVSSPSHKTANTCNKCNALFQGLNSPIGSYIQGDIFDRAVRQMQYRNAVSNAHHSTSPQRISQNQKIPASKNSPNKLPGDFCECCHALEDELRNTRHVCGQFPLSSMSRTSKQATRESPDYVPFHSHDKDTQEPKSPIHDCTKCFTMEGHLRNSLFRDMRSCYEYGALQWQKQVKDGLDCYAHKDSVPYAPFNKEPEVSGSSMTSCTHCKDMRSSLFPHKIRPNKREWNPYSLKDGSFSQPSCWKCDSRGLSCDCSCLGNCRHR